MSGWARRKLPSPAQKLLAEACGVPDPRGQRPGARSRGGRVPLAARAVHQREQRPALHEPDKPREIPNELPPGSLESFIPAPQGDQIGTTGLGRDGPLDAAAPSAPRLAAGRPRMSARRCSLARPHASPVIVFTVRGETCIDTVDERDSIPPPSALA
jgi:hypothetical protein